MSAPVFILQEGLHAAAVNQPYICKWHHYPGLSNLKRLMKEAEHTASVCTLMLRRRRMLSSEHCIQSTLLLFFLKGQHENRPGIASSAPCATALFWLRPSTVIKDPRAITISLLKAVNNSWLQYASMNWWCSSSDSVLSTIPTASSFPPNSHPPHAYCTSIRPLTSAVNLHAQYWHQAVQAGHWVMRGK